MTLRKNITGKHKQLTTRNKPPRLAALKKALAKEAAKKSPK